MNPEETIEAVVDRVAELLHRRIGLRFEPTMRDRLHRAVSEEATQHATSLAGYLDLLLAHEQMFQGLLNRITVQETAFFRHPDHFEVLANDILPTLRPPVRIWSTACSNGQEAYSIAMTLDERQVDGTVIATDLSTTALRRATEARYTTRELTGLSADRRARHLTRAGHGWEVTKPVRDRVSVFRHNLMETIPERARGCQVVFCRNVLIYFSPQQARDFLDRLADALAPDASLFLGAAETIWQVTDRFTAVKVGDSFVHRPTGSAQAVPAPRAPQPSPRRAVPSVARRRTAVPATARGDRDHDPARAGGSPPPPAVQRQDRTAQAALAANAGQAAAAAGDGDAAVVAFRKWAYLVPEDAMAHLHLGLAFQATGDLAAARRSFAAARHALLTTDQAGIEHALGGYAPDELLKFLDAKEQEGCP